MESVNVRMKVGGEMCVVVENSMDEKRGKGYSRWNGGVVGLRWDGTEQSDRVGGVMVKLPMATVYNKYLIIFEAVIFCYKNLIE